MTEHVSLYLVATPIGNLNDLSPRALEILGSVDFIAAEDTRKSGVLLHHFGIKKPMVSYFEHNRIQRGEIIVERLKQGETCALITDAGMPAISDPGEELVAQCHAAGLRICGVPGPCAFVTALAMSGMSTKRFCFEGFLSTAHNSRFRHLEELADEKRTMIFYEAPHKLIDTLKDMATVFGNDRRVAFVRELTKIYEEVRHMTLGEAIAYYEMEKPRGEFVLVMDGASEDEPETYDEAALSRMFAACIEQGMTKSEAAKEVSAKTGLPKREIYDMFKN